MLRGISIAASGMQAAQAQSEIIGDNIANIQTPGYKEEDGIKEPFPKMLLSRLESLIPYNPVPIGERGDGVTIKGNSINPLMGLLDQTNRNEDFALTTEGYFSVETPQGERYTRNGHFQLDDNGTLMTQEGLAVLGEKGVISGLSKDFKINKDGMVFDNGQPIDKLKIVVLPTDKIKREGQSLYACSETPAEAQSIQLLQGTLEKSNVDLSNQMEKMIVAMRAYEANQKMIQTQDATLEKAVNEVGKV